MREVQIETSQMYFIKSFDMLSHLEEMNRTVAIVASNVFPAVAQRNTGSSLEDIASLSVKVAKLICNEIEHRRKPESKQSMTSEDLF